MDEFLRAYIACALWASYEDEDGRELDKEDLSESAIKRLTEDATAFFNDFHTRFIGHESQAGHDFWLTRNHHGTGFWDRPKETYTKENAKFLTYMADAYGSLHLYYGDDGKIYHE